MYSFIKEPANGADSHETAKKLEKTEAIYKISFPEVWKQYILVNDGAKIHLRTFRVDGYLYEVSKLIPLCGEGLTFEKIVQNDRADGFISDQYYPVASNRGGDLYYWDAGSGAVYLVLSDDIEHPVMISRSMKAFFELLN